ncbi:MAG: type IV pilus modification protein PilV [Magnetococcales bacterium]|nr:type IV pilus modification protein PilV [Magnetococcales bacterium]
MSGSGTMGGFSLLEVMLTLMIVTFGILGIANLQAKAQLAQLDAYQRAQALMTMSDIVDRLLLNRSTASCFAFTDDTAVGTPYIGTDGANHLGTPVCTVGDAALNAMAVDAIDDFDELLKGAVETKDGGNVGAMVGARACISYDSATELTTTGGALLDGTGEYTIAVVWQGQGDSAPSTASNCAYGLYGAETKRRVVTTKVRLAHLS